MRNRSHGAGRHRRTVRPRRARVTPARASSAFPALLGPGRRAAWRRFVIRRVLAVLLVVAGYGLALVAGTAAAAGR